MTDTFPYGPSATGSEALAEQRYVLAAIATLAHGFAHGRWSDAPPAERLQELVETACRCLPLAQHAAVVSRHDGMQLLVGANDPVMHAWTLAESALGHGPLHDVLIDSMRLVSSDELHDDPRWSDLAGFSRRATSIHSLWSRHASVEMA